MKIWWPWRKKKLLLSLFDPPFGYDAEAQFPRFADESGKPYPKNAPGPFYVANTECIACGYPHVLAPDLMAWDTHSQSAHSHCYFKKQPEGPPELSHAINAIT